MMLNFIALFVVVVVVVSFKKTSMESGKICMYN